MEHDWYAILGVSTDADFAAIFAAYRRLARQHHPDFGGSHSQMVLLNKALEVLRDPERRREFDEVRKATADAATMASWRKTEAAAQAAAEEYPTDWDGLERFWNSMAQDFKRADHQSGRFLGMRWPTAYNSLSGTAFILGGGFLGVLAAAALLGKPPTTPGGTTQISPLLLMIGACGGAWVASFAHRLAGIAMRELRATPASKSDDDVQRVQIIECQNCRQKLRVPESTQDLNVTCTKCRHSFTFAAALTSACPRELFLVSGESSAVVGAVNMALFMPTLNYLAGAWLGWSGPWCWGATGVLAGTIASRSTAWSLGNNLMTLAIRAAESEEIRNRLRPLRKPLAAEASALVFKTGAVGGLCAAILSGSLGTFWRYATMIVAGAVLGWLVYQAVAAFLKEKIEQLKTDWAASR